MRYRQPNPQLRNSDQQAKALISNNDVLSTKEQEEVIAYFARSLRSSTQFLKVVVCLHVLVALVYLSLLLSGSMLFDLEVSHDTTMRLRNVVLQQAAQQQQPSTANAGDAGTAAGVAPPPIPPTHTADPLAVLAALDAQQQTANKKYTNDFLERRNTALTAKAFSGTNLLSTVVMLHSVGLLLWAAWSGFLACRLLRVDVNELTSTEPRELGTAPRAGERGRQQQQQQKLSDEKYPRPPPGTAAERLRARLATDPPAAQYVIAALAGLATLFWLAVLLRRQWAMQAAYRAAGLEAPSVFAVNSLSDALLEYVLALWQPLFHAAVGRLLRSMLDTKENLIELSRIKYKFDKV